ncbi:MAG: ribokinase [Anaerolineae bacterium]|nr:ribokinase [Anaerolineae bacterium]
MQQPVQEIDYLIVGHVCQDLTPEGPRLGGTATFGALTAQMMGLRVGVLTSTSSDLDSLLSPLQSIPLICIPSDQPTTFRNTYTPAGREQMLLTRARDLQWRDLPPEWQSPAIVHLAPVANEVDPALAGRFNGALVGVTPQGWMRCWDEYGQVSFQPWVNARRVLEHAWGVIFSIEDVEGDEDFVQYIANQSDVLVVTRGREGCTLYIQGQPTHIPALAVSERDSTGAGDVFAAAFFARLKATNDPLASARFATMIAGDSVMRAGLESIPDAATIQAALSSI